MALRDAMELLLHQRNQTRQRRFVAASPRQQQTRDVRKRSGNSRILRRFRGRRAIDAVLGGVARSPVSLGWISQVRRIAIARNATPPRIYLPGQY